jgi:hypothetical protein
VITFADNATVVNPMSTATFTSASPLSFGGETNWEAGLKAARLLAATSPSPTIIVFITDGIPNKYLNASGGVVSTADSALATNEAISEVNQIYTLSPPVPIVGIGVGNVSNYLDALLGTASVQSSFSNIYGELDQFAKKMCPDIRLSKSMSPPNINYYNNPGPHTVTIYLTVISTAGANSNVTVQDILAPELTNPVSTDPNVVITGSTVTWTLPTLAASGSATTSIKAVVNPPAGLTCNGVTIKNWAQVIHTDQAVHSTPNNMGTTGPAEQDEASAGLYVYNCQPTPPVGLDPVLYVTKTSLESCYPQGQTQLVTGKPVCEFTVTVTAFNGDYTGTVNFGDAVFNTTGIASTPSAISSMVVTTDDSAIVPAVASLCPNSFTSLPAVCSQAGLTLHQNKTITLKYKLSSPPDLAPGNYRNCFKATGSSLTATQSDWPAFNVTTPNSQNGGYWGYCGSFSVPASTNKVQPPSVVPTPKCNGESAKLVGKECRCTIPGMVPVSKTACDCPKGQDVRNGRCAFPPPPPPKCDRATTVAQGQSCVCRFDHMGKVSDTSCRCDRGYQFAPGKGCIKLPPDCPRGSRYNNNRNRCEPVCVAGTRYDVAKNTCIKIVVAPRCDRVTAVPKGDSCVCRYEGMVKRGAGSCRCAVRGSVFVPGKGCVERERPREVRCPFPLIPNPLTGKCMRLDIPDDPQPEEPKRPVDQP